MFEWVAEAFKMSGGWGYVILLGSLALYALIVVQFIKVKTKDFRPILWGLFAFVMIAGPLGTVIGLQQAGLAISSVPAQEQLASFARGISLAIYTTGLSYFFCGWGVIPLAIASGKVAKRLREQQSA